MIGIAVIWDDECRSEVADVLTKALKEQNLCTEWTVLPPFKSVFDRARGGLIPVDSPPKEWNVEKVGLVLLHLNNEGGKGFYLEQCQAIPSILFSSAPIAEDRREKIPKAPDHQDKKDVIYIGGFISKIKNLPLWLKVWKEDFALDANKLPLTHKALDCGEMWEQEALLDKAKKILDSFIALDILLQGYLAIRDGEMIEVDGKSWAEFKKEHKILQDEQQRQEAFHQTGISRLIRAPGTTEEEGYYWFDECAEDIKSSYPFDDTSDEYLKRICESARKNGKFSNPQLPMLGSKASGKLRIVWDVLRSHYGDEKGRDESFHRLPDEWRWNRGGQKWYESKALAGNNRRIAELFDQAHGEYVSAIQKIQCYLE